MAMETIFGVQEMLFTAKSRRRIAFKVNNYSTELP